jgi:hypothetical protein
VIYDEQYVVLDSKNSLLYCIEKYVLITILTTRSELFKKWIRIEMKTINTDAWLVNFILFFSGLSPILIGPKFNFFKSTWHRRPQQCVHRLDSTQPKGPALIKFHLKKLQFGPTKSFSSYMNNTSLQEQFWAQTSYKRAKFVLWRIRFVTIGMPHRFLSSVAKLQDRTYDVLYRRFSMRH